MLVRNLGNILGTDCMSDRPAVIDLSDLACPVTYRYQDLHQAASAYARLLRARHFPPKTTIGIFALNSFHNLAAYMGIMQSGLVAVPVNTKLPAHTIKFVCKDARIELAFADKKCRKIVPQGIELITLPLSGYQGDSPISLEDIHRPETGETAVILYTSGSTGRPKGVVLSHNSQWAMIKGTQQASNQSLFSGRRGIVAAPMFHMNALIFITSFLSQGGSIVLLPKFDAATFIEAISRHEVNMITGVPTMIALMARERNLLAQTDLSTVSHIFIGSSPVTDTVISQALQMMPDSVILNSYGTTETGGGLFGAHPDGLPRPTRSVGYPLPHIEIRLRGESENTGVLEIKTPSAMTEYLNLPELTQDRIRDGWITTGDVFERDSDGFLFFIGRDDDMFVCNGENIYPSEIEKVIEHHTGVVQTCVVPLEHDIHGSIPVAFVVLKDTSKLNEKDITQYVLENAPAYMHPRHVFILDTLPLAGTNKIDRNSLLQTARDRVKKS
ncbi:class I adenylate-forming enzyme family protein [Haliea sp.]